MLKNEKTDIIDQQNQESPIIITQQGNSLILSINSIQSSKIELNIFDINGTKIYEKFFENDRNEYIIETNLRSGVYFCKVKTVNKECSQKIEIVR